VRATGKEKTMGMKTYRDLSRKQRSLLTAEEVEKWLDAELMIKGVLRVKPPVLDKVEDVTIETTTYFEVGGSLYGGQGLLFSNEEDALTVTKMLGRVFVKEHEYFGGDTKYIAKSIEYGIKPIAVMSEQEAINKKAALQRSGEAKANNLKLQKEYDDATKEQNKVLNGVWEDWHECRSLGERHQRILSTREEYRQLVAKSQPELDEDSRNRIAEGFLLKSFDAERVLAADEWQREE
jgi:hypothetical protein